MFGMTPRQSFFRMLSRMIGFAAKRAPQSLDQPQIVGKEVLQDLHAMVVEMNGALGWVPPPPAHAFKLSSDQSWALVGVPEQDLCAAGHCLFYGWIATQPNFEVDDVPDVPDWVLNLPGLTDGEVKVVGIKIVPIEGGSRAPSSFDISRRQK